MYVMYNFQLFQCLCTLFKDSYKDETIIEYKIMYFISVFSKYFVSFL